MSMDDYKELKETIKNILSLISTFPDKFQPVLLEVLLKNALDSSRKTDRTISPVSIRDQAKEFILPIDVRAFFIQYDMKESLLDKLFYIEKNQIFPIWRIKTVVKSEAQIQIAMLMALENALKTGVFEFSYEEIRNKCKELIVYDANNFSTNFKVNQKYFKSFEDRDRIALSPEGKERLANALLELTRE